MVLISIYTMIISFLGTGTSQGVPVIGCRCKVCTSSNSQDNRLRCSVMICVDNQKFIIDTGPDFRQQMLRENVEEITAILFTHSHNRFSALYAYLNQIY